MSPHLPASSPGSPSTRISTPTSHNPSVGLLASRASTSGPAKSDPAPALASGSVSLPAPWCLENGATLEEASLGFELCGPAEAPVIVVLGGISASAHVTATDRQPEGGWWPDLTGPGRAIDTDRFRVLGIDFLGGPNTAYIPRLDGRPAQTSIPTTGDQARALAHLLTHLGIDSIHTFLGSSYGGMVALAFAAEFPERVEQLVILSAAHHSHPRSTAWRSLQRKIVELARSTGNERQGLVLARGLAMTTYRSPEELQERFDAPPRSTSSGFRFPIDDYLEARGQAFADSFDGAAFLRLSESIDLHRVDPREIETPATLVAVRQDQLVPVEQLRQLHEELGGPCRLLEIDSLYGHDAFLKEIDALDAILCGCLGEEV